METLGACPQECRSAKQVVPVVLGKFRTPTVEIMLNADGCLWQERLGEPMTLLGQMRASQAEAVIKTVAGFYGNATVSNNPSSSLQSPNLLGGSGASGSVGGAVSKAAAGLQDGPSLGAAPRQPSIRREGRKIDDAGPVGRRDKQQEWALEQQEKTAKRERERHKDDKEKTRENAKPVPPADSKPSTPTDDEINAFRDRRLDANADQDGMED